MVDVLALVMGNRYGVTRILVPVPMDDGPGALTRAYIVPQGLDRIVKRVWHRPRWGNFRTWSVGGW